VDLPDGQGPHLECPDPERPDPERPDPECTVWWAAPDDIPPTLHDVLDADEQARAARFLRPVDRERFRAAHVLTRVALGRSLGVPPAAVRLAARCRTCSGPHGKPYVVEPGAAVEFSLSHAGDVVAVALAGVPVGLDVELPGAADPDVVAGVALAPAERSALDALAAAARADGFLHYWTAKEAVLKATGHGLAVAPAHVVISAPGAPLEVLDLPAALGAVRPRLWAGRLGPATACVAMLGPGPAWPPVEVRPAQELFRCRP
jgi:4'-phosphopantetheinyl transferase